MTQRFHSSLPLEHTRRHDDVMTSVEPRLGKPVVVAVIPAHNEERFIASVVLNALRYATHVIVVDDGSTDRTADLAAACGAVVLRQWKNLGKAAALTAGFDHGARYAPDVFVCLDGDAQHDPADIPVLVQPVLEGRADVVIGSRFLEVRSTIPRWRRAGQHALTLVTNTLSGTPVTDSQSGYRAFAPGAVGRLNLHGEGLSVESEMQFAFRDAHLRVTEVGIRVSYLDGNKRNPVVHGLQVIDAMLSLVARQRPLLFVSAPGVALTAVGVLTGLTVAFGMDRTGELMTGTALATVLLIVIGILLAVSGVLLHSMGHFVTRMRQELLDAVRGARRDGAP